MDVAKKSLKLEIIQCIYILLKHFLRKSLYILCIYSVVQCIYTGLSSGLRVMQIVGGPFLSVNFGKVVTSKPC